MKIRYDSANLGLIKYYTELIMLTNVFKKEDLKLVDKSYDGVSFCVSLIDNPSNPDYKIFFSHIVFHDYLKLPNLKYSFIAFDKCLGEILKLSKNLDISNSIQFTFYHLEKGIKFVPDSKMIEKVNARKEKIENEQPIKLGGVVIILKSNYTERYKEAILEVNKSFNTQSNIDVVRTDEEALEAVGRFLNLDPNLLKA